MSASMGKRSNTVSAATQRCGRLPLVAFLSERSRLRDLYFSVYMNGATGMLWA